MRIRRHLAGVLLAGAAVGMFAVAAPASAAPTTATDVVTDSASVDCRTYAAQAQKYRQLSDYYRSRGETAKAKDAAAKSAHYMELYKRCMAG